MKNEIEFKVGDKVTFQPYEENEPIKAIVREVDLQNVSFDKNDKRVFYRLSGDGKPLISRCTGLSIKESKYYVSMSVNNWSK